MLKSVSRFLIAFCLLSAFLSRAEAQKSAADYWPIKAGSVWKFVTISGGSKIYGTTKVTRVVKDSQGAVATITETIGQNPGFTEKYRVSKQGVFRLVTGANASIRLDPPLPILKSPFKIGDAWDWSGKMSMAGQDNDAMGHITVSGPETVKTPAGTFKAIKIHFLMTIDMNGQKMEIPTDYYLVAGVGMVRQTAQVGELAVDAKLVSMKLKK
jgi:hypothetical protein